MSTSVIFQNFLATLALDNKATISTQYEQVTRALNQQFRTTDSTTANSLQVGSIGRKTAIRGVSDLDMLYIVPASEWPNYANKGQSAILKDTKDAILKRYPNTNVVVDRLVVRVLFKKSHIEVQPVFEQTDGKFRYPDSYNGGSWKLTDPRPEIAAMIEGNVEKNNNLRRLCKMARAWKNKHGLGIGGLLIDTLAYNFMNSTYYFDNKSYNHYDEMVRDFFLFLSELPDQDYFAALGSKQRVRVKQKFQKKATKAYNQSVTAMDQDSDEAACKKWRLVFGRPFPLAETIVKAVSMASGGAQNEQFMEDLFPFDIRYIMKLECEVTQQGWRPKWLRELVESKVYLKPKKKLRFFVAASNYPREATLYWKVLNRGPEAVRREMVRGQIHVDEGKSQRNERTDFVGDHVVDCYAVINEVVVATDRIHVPIGNEAPDADGQE